MPWRVRHLWRRYPYDELLAFTAHDHAYFDARVLHRDISLGNIFIIDEGRGLLIDWDLCFKVNADGCPLTPRRLPERIVGICFFAGGGALF